MKRAALILVLGLVLGASAYCGFYFAGTATHRALLESAAPELAWLKKEFNLSDAEFARVSGLHDTYRSECARLCRQIDAKNDELKELLAGADRVTPEIEARLDEAARLRVQCQKNMLRHFLEVSRSMPPEQGKRYLAWVQEKTFMPEHRMHEPDSHPATPDEHVHGR